ncbi:MAG: DUF1127 domain-containing protein [Pseudomonadota bacterium]
MAYVAQEAGRARTSTGWFSGLVSAFLAKRDEWRTYNELMALPDSLLDDLGVNREELRDVARRATYGR